MLNLSGDIWKRWESKHEELKAKGTWNLAGLFRGQEGPGFHCATQKVLYTGKATAGPFDSATAAQDSFGCNRKAFWSFARRLSQLTGGDAEKLGNIAWSDICQIGLVEGNPGSDLVGAQQALAIETLRQEWLELKPSLVVCVAEGYEEQLIYKAFGVTQGQGDGFNEVTVPNGTFWQRPPLDGMPAFLWMKHPQGKPKEYIQAAEKIAEELLKQHKGV